MAVLIRGWFDDGYSHAVVHDQRKVTLCGEPDPTTREGVADRWDIAPSPKCQRCEQIAISS
jgi:hypothetical protein